MQGTISVTSESLDAVKQSLFDACEEYKTNLTKLEGVITQITNGDFVGDPATDFKNKYESKKDTFDSLRNVIDEAEEYMKTKGIEFNTLVDDLASGMR